VYVSEPLFLGQRRHVKLVLALVMTWDAGRVSSNGLGWRDEGLRTGVQRSNKQLMNGDA